MAGSGPGGAAAAGGDLGPVRGAPAAARGVGPTLRRLARYLERRYGLSHLLDGHLVEGRRYARVPLADVVRSAFLLFAQRLGSLNALEEVLGRRGRPLVGGAVPSADTVAYAYSRMDPAGLRAVVRETTRRARRRKALRHRGAPTPWTVALDGHELFASFRRCCPGCSRREVTSKDGVRIQYYHRMVAAQLVDAEPPLCLDAELQGPGEDEVAAAARVLERVARAYPWVEVFTADALYFQEPFLRKVVELGRAAIVPLKEERRDLYRDVQGLLAAVPPREATVDGERVQVWDLPGFRVGEGPDALAVRVVRTVRWRRVRERVAGLWVQSERLQDWCWLTVGLGPRVSALTIHRLGHARWDQENCGFNEQDRFFGLDHCFRHHPKAILNFVLTLFLAAGLTEIFFTRNLKDPVLCGLSLSGLARLLLEDPPRAWEPSVWARAP